MTKDLIFSGIVLFKEIATVALLVYVYGHVCRLFPRKQQAHMIMASFFGGAAALAMVSPIVLMPGVIVDMRNLIVGLSGALFGPLAAAITLTIAAVSRMAIGGAGLPAGLLAMGLATLGGLIWRVWIDGRLGSAWLSRLALSAMISTHLIAFLLLPASGRQTFLTTTGPTLLIMNVIGVLIITTMTRRERALLLETRSLARAATTDPLTHLLNRRSAEAAYANIAASEAPHLGTAMLYVDVDNFKQINDRHGHPAGDRVLISISRRVSSVLRHGHVFARLGGDEFLVVLADVSRSDADIIAERCRSVVSDHAVVVGGVEIPVTISIGGDWTPEKTEFGRFVAAADAALNRAKDLGRDCVTFAQDLLQLPACPPADQVSRNT